MGLNIEFKRYERLTIDGIEWSVERRTSEGFLLVGVGDGFNRAFTSEELVAAFSQGRLIKQRPDQEAGQPRDDFAALPEGARKEALLRKAVIEQIFVAGGPPPYNDALLAKLLPDACTAASQKPTSVTSFRRWLRTYLRAPDDLFVLAPQFRRAGRRLGPDAAAETIIQEMIDEQIMQKVPISGQDLYDLVINKIDEVAKLDKSLAIIRPSRATVYRRLAAQDDYQKLKTQAGSRQAYDKYGNVMPGPLEHMPLGVVEIDHSRFNCQAVTKDGVVIGRPWVSAAIDRCTRATLAVILTFDPPSTATVLLLLKMIILGKDDLLKQYPSIKHAWPCLGLPRFIVCDNGVEFHSKDFQDALDELRIGVLYCPTRCPEMKGRAERWFLTLQKGVVDILPGTTFSRIGDKTDRDPAMDASIELDRLTGHVYRFNVDTYLQRKHSGMRQAPIKVWEDKTALHPVRLPASRKDVDLACLRVDWRTIQRQGVEINGFFYQSRELSLIRISQKALGKVEVRWNPLDLGSIYVRGQKDHAFIEVPCVASEARGMSVWQRKAVLEHLGANAGGATAAELRQTKREMFEEARATLAKGPKTKKIGKKNRAARILGQQSSALTVLTTFPPPVAASPIGLSPPASTQPAPAPSGPRLAPPNHDRSAEQLAAIAANAGMRPIRRI
ncbi:MAG: transposase family protein [Roseiarcus sp.]